MSLLKGTSECDAFRNDRQEADGTESLELLAQCTVL